MNGRYFLSHWARRPGSSLFAGKGYFVSPNGYFFSQKGYFLSHNRYFFSLETVVFIGEMAG